MEGRQVLLFVGRLIDIKNLFFLLDAFALVVKRYPKAILLFVGDGDQREALERHAERNGLANHVIFAGKKQGEDLYACYNIGQIFVLPSYYERFGAVVNEALLAGCYTLCSVVAGAACLIEPRKMVISLIRHLKRILRRNWRKVWRIVKVLDKYH